MQSTSPYSVIFFDWGGVIASDPGDDFLAQLLRDIGATEPQIEEIFKTYMYRFMCGQISEAEYWESLRREYSLSIHDSISDEFKKWRGLIADAAVLQLAQEAKAQGMQTAIFSNVIEPTYNAIEQAGYYSQFDALIASCKVGLAKPDPAIYQLALDELHTIAAQSIFIDDKQANLEPAAAMGFKTILATSSEQIVRDVRACWDT